MGATTKVIDMTDVRDKGNFNPRRVKPGDYRAKVVAVEDHKPKDSAAANQWVFTVSLVDNARATYPYYVGWDKDQAWKSHGLAVAAGLIPADKRAKMKFDPNKLVGKEIGVALDDDEYNGKVKSKIVQVFSPSELGKANGPDDVDEDDVDEDDTDIDEDVDLEDI